ncbi:hypothetical protein IL306_012335, partial [Fusarium sp. DS 682]
MRVDRPIVVLLPGNPRIDQFVALNVIAATTDTIEGTENKHTSLVGDYPDRRQSLAVSATVHENHVVRSEVVRPIHGWMATMDPNEDDLWVCPTREDCGGASLYSDDEPEDRAYFSDESDDMVCPPPKFKTPIKTLASIKCQSDDVSSKR